MKKLICTLLAAISILTIFTLPAFAKYTAVTNVNEACQYIHSAHSLITIKPATLYQNGKYHTVYTIALKGSNMSWNKEDLNNMQSCIKAGLSLDNPYFDELKKQALESIPDGSDIILMGHSLGGMVAQQFAADKEIKEKYNVVNILTMGSPYIVLKDRMGDIHRMVDNGDVIPYLSTAVIGNGYLGNYTLESNGYFGRPNSAHNESYVSGEKWLQYDCFGIKDGNTKFIIW